MSEFTCFKCKETFTKIRDGSWNEFMAAKEMLEIMPEAKNSPTDILCDDCHKEFLDWFAKLTPKEKEAMQNE